MLSATGMRRVSTNATLADAFEASEYSPLQASPGDDASGIWPVTGVEECFACCYLSSPGARDELAPAPDAWERACDWVEVTGADIQISANGLYQKLPRLPDADPAGQGRPVYVHTNGLLSLFFLARACMHEDANVCPRRGPGWVISDAIGRDSARVLAWAATDAPADIVGHYWHEWDGSDYVKAPLPRPFFNTTLNADGSVNASVLDRIENQGLVTVKVLCASPEMGEKHHTPIPFWGTPGQRILNFTTTVGFIDGKEHSNMTFPDRDGVLISTGNPQAISALGTLVSPITAYSGQGRLSRLEMGLEWETVNVTSEAAGSLVAALELGGLRYCFIKRSTCFALCHNQKLPRASPEGASCRRFSCVLPLPRSAFSENCSVMQHTSAKSAAQNPIDAIIIEGPTADETYEPKLGNAAGTTGKLLFLPVAGIWSEQAFCRTLPMTASDEQGQLQHTNAVINASLSPPRPCRAIELTQPVGTDNASIVRDGTEGDCLTWRDDSSYVSCRAVPATFSTEDSTRVLVTGECVEQDLALTRQPVCVPEVVAHRLDRRAYPREGDIVEIGAVRDVQGHGNVSEMRERERRDRAQLIVGRVDAVANETNPYTYQLPGEADPLAPTYSPRVRSPIRLTMFMSAESMHYLTFSSAHASAERLREHQRGVGEAVVKSQ